MTTGATILLAEDDPNDAALFMLAWEKVCPATRVSVVCNGVQAVQYLKGEGRYADRTFYTFPEMVVLDLSLSIMNGFQVLQWVREQPWPERLFVVVLTGSLSNNDSRLAYQMGADDYVVKPCGLEALVERLARVRDTWFDRCKFSETEIGGPA
jgi:DNA-binding response OmpR family regulator